MKTIIKCILFCFILCTINTTRCQEISSEDPLILYKLNQTPGNYVLCSSFQTSKKETVSQIVIADTFAVRFGGATCDIVMSNAYFLNTKYSYTPTNSLNQYRIRIGVYVRSYPKDIKLIFNNSVAELQNAKIDGPIDAHMKTYVGEDALRHNKEMGLPPPDFDETNK